MSDTLRCDAPMLELDQYQREALRTVGSNNLTTLFLGLCGESGELADYLKKHLAQGHEFKRTKALEELGDLLWYVANAANQLDATLSEVAELNRDKLRKRFPDGFSAERSVNRSEP